jgi:carbonic anhydrase
MGAVDELLSRHAAFLADGEPPAAANVRPRLRLAIVTCMDSRIDMFRVLGLHSGDAHVLRNAGGLVTEDVVRSLVLSQRLLGTREVMVMQHTDCGLSGLHDADLIGRITAETLEEPPFTFGGFQDVDQSVRDGVERVRSSPWLPGREFVRGFVYDVDTTRVRDVSPTTT